MLSDGHGVLSVSHMIGNVHALEMFCFAIPVSWILNILSQYLRSMHFRVSQRTSPWELKLFGLDNKENQELVLLLAMTQRTL
jgi:hypothetical protein